MVEPKVLESNYLEEDLERLNRLKTTFLNP